MAQQMDEQVLITILTGAVNKTLGNIPTAPQTEEPKAQKEKIADEGGKMYVDGVKKFDAACYVSYVNYYLTQGDIARHNAKGFLVIYLHCDYAEKLFKAIGYAYSDENETTMFESATKLCNTITEALKQNLTSSGYADLVLSAPATSRNSVFAGIEYNRSQKDKHELSFYFWKQKALVVELALSDVPPRR